MKVSTDQAERHHHDRESQTQTDTHSHLRQRSREYGDMITGACTHTYTHIQAFKRRQSLNRLRQ